MLAAVAEAIEDIRSGRMVIVVDDEHRENEGDLILAAEKATPEAIAFMVRHCSGIVCVPMEAERLRALQLPLMAPDATDVMGTAFTVSVDARAGTTTGISARDRALTIKALVDPTTRPEDLARPGHVFPLRYTPGGVLRRAGHTEAAVDLARLAGLAPAGVLCELVEEDGSMARLETLERFAAVHNLKVLSIADIASYRRSTEKLVTRIGQARVPTAYGTFQAFSYESYDGRVHVALVKGDPAGRSDVLARVHSECLTGDALGSVRCDCGMQLRESMRRIAQEEAGVLVYLRGHEGRGIGLRNKLDAYALQDGGLDTVDANLHLGFAPDARDYGMGAQILGDLGVRGVRLLTNNPAKHAGLESNGINVTARVSLQNRPTTENVRYLEAKRDRLGHLLELVGADELAADDVLSVGEPEGVGDKDR